MRFAPLAGLASCMIAVAPALAQPAAPPVPDEPLHYFDDVPAAPGSPAAAAGVPTAWPEPAKAEAPKPKLVETGGGVAGSVVGQTLGTAAGGPIAGIAAGFVGGRLGSGAVRIVKKVFHSDRRPDPAPVQQAAAAPLEADDASATAPVQPPPPPEGEDFKVRGAAYPDPPPEAKPPPT